MTEKPYSDADVLDLQDAIADARIRGIGNGTYSMARAVLDALAAAGRLLPPDADTRTAHSPFVAINPAMRFGAPTMGNTRLSVGAVLGMLQVEPIAVVCDEYEITRGDVLVACWYAATYGTHELRKYRRQWREWADEVHGDLWKVTAVDYDKIPLPPGVGP